MGQKKVVFLVGVLIMNARVVIRKKVSCLERCPPQFMSVLVPRNSMFPFPFQLDPVPGARERSLSRDSLLEPFKNTAPSVLRDLWNSATVEPPSPPTHDPRTRGDIIANVYF